MPEYRRHSFVRAGDWRTVATLWNTNAIGVFRLPAGAEIKIRYGDGWPIGWDSQRQTLDGRTDRAISVGGWSIFVARMQVRVQHDTAVTWLYVVTGP
ncbi:MAG: hypothetical protein IT305_29640 [Chloroflexi bacterium]|nr:hypothetical protein [Chloroflexota bacterium]